MKNFKYILILVLILALVYSTNILADSVGEPHPGTVNRVSSYTFYPSTALTGSTTVYSASPQTGTIGQDTTRVSNWNSADVFLTAQIAASQRLTVTVQSSPDQAIWADTAYSTLSFDTAGTPIVSSKVYSIVLMATGTKMIRVPIAGEFMRFKIEKSGAVTPTISVTLRNN